MPTKQIKTPAPTKAPAPTRESLLAELQKAQNLLDQKTGKKSAPLTLPASAPAPIKAPELPQPTAPQKNEAFFTSLTGSVDTTRKTLETTLKTKLDDITKEKDRAQKNIDDLTDKQSVLIESDINPLLKPFRETLENKERERLHVNENFEANQKLTNELDALLTEGNTLLSLEKERAIPNVFINNNVNKRMSDIAARAGVIEAVMSARSGQIAEAYRMIDRSTDAITADRQDRLAYFETLYNFYEGKKDSEEGKLIDLKKDEKEYVAEQVSLLKGDLENAEKTVAHIKSLMVDPESARFMADAGVTLNDTVEQVNQKLAEQGRREEAEALKNELIAKGYTYVPFPQGRSGVKTFSVGGRSMSFVPPPEDSGSGSGPGDPGDPAGTFINEFGERIEGTVPTKAPTVGEQASFVFFQRMKDAMDTLEAYEHVTLETDLLDQFLLNQDASIFQDPEQQIVAQAMRQFTEARLRKDSGAAIPPEEFRNDRRTYFPSVGDKRDVLNRKGAARDNTLMAIRNASGRAYHEFYGEKPQAVGQRLLAVDALPDPGDTDFIGPIEPEEDTSDIEFAPEKEKKGVGGFIRGLFGF